jgi:hypothetical protein
VVDASAQYARHEWNYYADGRLGGGELHSQRWHAENGALPDVDANTTLPAIALRSQAIALIRECCVAWGRRNTFNRRYAG